MDSSDWSNGIRHHIFDTRPDTEFNIFRFQALSSKHFRRGFDRVNLHRPTMGAWPDVLGWYMRYSSAWKRNAARSAGQGLTHVHFSAQPEPFLAQNIP